VININQFTELIVAPTLTEVGLYSRAAVELLLGTALQESGLRYLKQLDDGPAMGPYQMEPATHDDIFENYLNYHADMKQRVLRQVREGFEPSAVNMAGNLYYATAMCRVHYWRVPEALPPQGDLSSQAAYWKEHYNTFLGRGTQTEYVENWERAHRSD
jgi:hypothetical protein